MVDLLPCIIPWNSINKRQPILSNPNAHKKWNKRLIISQHTNSFLEYYFQCMIKTNDNKNEQYLYKMVSDDIIKSIQESMLSYFRNELELIAIPTLIVEFMYNFRDHYIAWNPTKQLLLYINKNNFKWIQLKSPTKIKKFHLTKNIFTLYLQNKQIIRMFPICIYQQQDNNRFERECIDNEISIDWIIDGLLENVYDNISNNVILTHILNIEYGLIIRDINGNFGYLQCSKKRKNKRILLEKCIIKIFDNNHCKLKNKKCCSNKISRYCWNGCCKYHCINQRHPKQCLFHKKHWKSIHKFEEFRLQLCHRWD